MSRMTRGEYINYNTPYPNKDTTIISLEQVFFILAVKEILVVF